MNVIIESDRDQRTLAWLIAEVGEDAIEQACLHLDGARKPYVSNIAKLLGLNPPESLKGPSRSEARLRLASIKNLLTPNSKL